jgi:hypothetical protein
MVTSSEMQGYLEGIEYPTSKTQIIEVARTQGAPHDVLEILERVRDGEYFSLPDLMGELEEGEAELEV